MVKFTPTISQTEQKLSNELKKFGLNPKSQFKVKRRDKDYSYYIDIAFPDKKIAVEIDGPHHLDRGYEVERKDEYLKSEGWKVFRYPSDEIFQNTSAYVKKIKKIVEKTKSKTYPDQLTHTHKIIQEGLLNYGVRFEKSIKNKPKIEIYSDKPQKNTKFIVFIVFLVTILLFLVISKIQIRTNDSIKQKNQNPYLHYDKATIDLVALSGTEKAFLCDHCNGGYGFWRDPLARAYSCSCNGDITYHDYPSRKIITKEEISEKKENAIDKNDDVMKMLQLVGNHCFKVCGGNFLSSWAYPSIKVLQCYCRGEEKSRFFDTDSLNPIEVSENKEIKD